MFTPPLRALSRESSAGFECIDFAQDVLGITLLPWQRWLLVHALELLEDGTFRFRTVVLLVARQNGKSTLMQVLSLWRMFVDGAPLVIGTAQNLDVAEEQWQGAVGIVEDIPELLAEVEQVLKVNGKKQLKLVSGERYKVAAASRRGGRGLSGDLVLLDELREHQTWDAWAAVTKTTMARLRAQVWAASNAGDAASVVLRFLRRAAHRALGDPDGLDGPGVVEEPPEAEVDGVEDEDSLGIFEWSAVPGCDIWDRDGWAQANPSLGYTITEKAIAAAARTDPEWVFRTEVLCQWSDGTLDGPFPPGAWDACLDAESLIPAGGRFVFCVDVAWNRGASHIAAAGFREDGLPHVEVVASRAGTDWVGAWLAERAGSPGLAGLVFQSAGAPVSSLAEALEATTISLVPWTGSDLGRACGMFYDLVRAGLSAEGSPENAGLRHLRQPALDVPAAAASTRPLGDAWVWDRKKSAVDIGPLVAATGAVWALSTLQDEAEGVLVW